MADCLRLTLTNRRKRVLELKVIHNDKPVVLKLEHSLLSLSKWESKHRKAFLGPTAKTHVEMIEYFEDMLVTPGNKELVYLLSPEQLEEVTNYINSSRTASSVPEIPSKSPFQSEIITSELIYYWLVALRIPFEVEKWHLSRLLMLVRITNFKAEPPKKQNAAQKMADWRKMNEERKAKLGTKG
jgi:hypothetical protein